MPKKETKTAAAEAGSGEYTALQSEAMEAYGIDPRYVLACNTDEDGAVAVIVTHGGRKVRFKKGDKPKKLRAVDVTGEKE